MIEPALPRFRWGQRVVSLSDLLNDGSYPDVPDAALLVPGGTVGEVVQIGVHVESGTNVYMVEFGERRVVGCREDEIVAFEVASAEAMPGETP